MHNCKVMASYVLHGVTVLIFRVNSYCCGPTGQEFDGIFEYLDISH